MSELKRERLSRVRLVDSRLFRGSSSINPIQNSFRKFTLQAAFSLFFLIFCTSRKIYSSNLVLVDAGFVRFMDSSVDYRFRTRLTRSTPFRRGTFMIHSKLPPNVQLSMMEERLKNDLNRLRFLACTKVGR